MSVRPIDELLEMRTAALDYWSEPINRFNDLIDVYHGNFQKLWPGEFRRGETPKVANWIRLGWKRYAQMVGKVPVTHVTPSKLSRISQTKADKIEKIQAGYDTSSVMEHVMYQYAWYLVGLGAAVLTVMPDSGLKGPRFGYRDPRTVLPSPGVGSVSSANAFHSMLTKPDMSIASMPWAIINEVQTGSALMDTYRQDWDRLPNFLNGTNYEPNNVMTYMDHDHWVVTVNEKIFKVVEHGLGFVPLRYTAMTVPDQLGGESMFEQNIGLVLAYMRTLNQKLAYNENVVWPWLVVKGVNNMDVQQRTIELMDRDGDAKFLNPPGEIQAERDLDTLDRIIRILNQDTESLRGEAPGSTVTGRGLGELNRTVTTQVQEFWRTMKPDVEFIRSAALMIDEEVYGSKTKSIIGRTKGESFEEKYTPKKDIKGHHSVSVDFGIGVGGFEGFVELMQMAAQGYLDEQTVMENAPWIRSVSDTRKKVMLDRLEKLIFEMTSGGAPSAIINHMSEWHEAIQEGNDPWKWIKENPMPEPEPVAPEAGGLPGLEGGAAGPQPPGGGAPPSVPTPSPSQILALAQGGGR